MKRKGALLLLMCMIINSIIVPVASLADVEKAANNSSEVTESVTTPVEKETSTEASKETKAPTEKETSTEASKETTATKDKKVATEAKSKETEAKIQADEASTLVKVMYAANGGTGPTASYDSMVQGANYTPRTIGTGANQVDFKAKDPKKQIFENWNTKADGNGTSYQAGVAVTWSHGEDVTLHAQWKPASTLSFDFNGVRNPNGVAEPSSTFAKVGTKVTVPAIPDSLVSNIAGLQIEKVWNTAADGTGTDYAPGSTYTLTDTDRILYIKIEADQNAMLTFDLAGGTASSTDIKNGIKTNASNGYKVTIPTETPTKTGYRFDGWVLKSVTYKAGAEVNVRSSAVAKARWIGLSSITYNNGLPSGVSDSDVSNMPNNITIDSTGEDYIIPTNVLTRKASGNKQYIFDGWKVNGGEIVYQGGKLRLPDMFTTGTFNLVAQWIEFDKTSQYKLFFSNEGADAGTQPDKINMYIKKGESVNIQGQGGMTKSGYTFMGWTDGKSTYLPGQSYTPTDAVATNSVIVLKPVWQQGTNNYTLRYDIKGTGVTPSSQVGKFGTQVTIEGMPEGNQSSLGSEYKFWGWTTEPNGNTPM